MDYNKQRKYALSIFRGEKYAELRKAIKNGECFDELFSIAEKAGALEHWDEFVDEWKERASYSCSGITDEMKIKAFEEMREDEWLYYVGCDWTCITSEMKIKAFKKMKNEGWKYFAGRDWTGITDKVKKEVLEKMENKKWKYYAGRDWFK